MADNNRYDRVNSLCRFCGTRGSRPGSGVGGVGLMSCGRCHMAWYCGTQCQAADWRFRHRRECPPLAAIHRAREANPRPNLADNVMEIIRFDGNCHPCLDCGTMTGNFCDVCERTTICTSCDNRFLVCARCRGDRHGRVNHGTTNDKR